MSMLRLLTLGLAAAALLSATGCKKPEEAAGKRAPGAVEDAASTPADAAAPLNFAYKNTAAEVSLKLPADIARQPDLHARLYSEGVASLRQFAEGAANARAEEGEEGPPPQPFERSVEWHVGADTGKLFSVWSLQTEYAGGAHGNASFHSMLWDKALNRSIPAMALFDAGVDEAMNKALCDALTAAKKERLKETYQAPSADTWTCPKWRDISFTLVPSTTPGKSGGMVFLIPPYIAGAYAEGDYRVTVPASAFKTHLKPAYADEFAGSPSVPKVLSAQP